MQLHELLNNAELRKIYATATPAATPGIPAHIHDALAHAVAPQTKRGIPQNFWGELATALKDGCAVVTLQHGTLKVRRVFERTYRLFRFLRNIHRACDAVYWVRPNDVVELNAETFPDFANYMCGVTYAAPSPYRATRDERDDRRRQAAFRALASRDDIYRRPAKRGYRTAIADAASANRIITECARETAVERLGGRILNA